MRATVLSRARCKCPLAGANQKGEGFTIFSVDLFATAPVLKILAKDPAEAGGCGFGDRGHDFPYATERLDTDDPRDENPYRFTGWSPASFGPFIYPLEIEALVTSVN